MIFKLQTTQNKKLEQYIISVMSDLEKFYNIKWTHNKPHVFTTPSKEVVSEIFNREVPSWSIGWKWNNNVIVLDYKIIKKEVKDYTPQKYCKLIKHELSHCFYGVLSNNITGPKWLWEGVALYTAQQNNPSSSFKKFDQFLDFYNKHKIGDKNVYYESGAVIEILLKKYGKNRLLQLIKCINSNQTKKDFNLSFEKIYGFKLNYKNFNILLK